MRPHSMVAAGTLIRDQLVTCASCCRDGGGRRTRLLYGLATIKHCTDSIDHTMLDEILSKNVEYIARTKHKI